MKRPISTLGACTAALAALAGLWACAGPKEPAVAKLRVEPQRLVLPYPGYRELRLDLTPLQPLQADVEPVVFVHLLDEAGDVLRTFDHPAPAPWRVGKKLRYRIRLHQSAMADSLPPGLYRLTVGIYQPEGDRWRLQTPAREVDGAEYEVATVEVPDPPSPAPRFEFSSAWSDPVVGNDLQVLARRWLAGAGTLRVSDLAPPGRLWLALEIPPPPTDGVRAFREEQSDPVVVVSSTCGGVEISAAGLGRHELELAVAGEAEVCEIEFRPNFYDQLGGGFDRRAFGLEAVSWIGR